MTVDEHIERIRSLVPANSDTPDSVIAAVDQALQQHPSSAALWCFRGDLIQTGTEDSTFTLADARQSHERALELDPDFAEAYEELGHFFDVIEDDPRQSEAAFREAVRLGAGIHSFLGLARVLAESGRRGEAIAFLDNDAREFASETEVVELRAEIVSGLWDPACDGDS